MRYLTSINDQYNPWAGKKKRDRSGLAATIKALRLTKREPVNQAAKIKALRLTKRRSSDAATIKDLRVTKRGPSYKREPVNRAATIKALRLTKRKLNDPSWLWTYHGWVPNWYSVEDFYDPRSKPDFRLQSLFKY